MSLGEENSLLVELAADGIFKTTTIDVGEADGYDGIITGLRLVPLVSCKKGDSIKLKQISIE